MKSKMKILRKEIDNSIDKYLQKTTKVILSATKSYPNDWDKTYDKIEELFYEFLTEVYKNVNTYLKSIYRTLPELDVKDIFDLTYDIDGKHITDRLKEYWNEAGKNLASSLDNLIGVQNYLINMYDRILFTESRVVESKVKKMKKPIDATLLVIESGCDLCQGGEYPPDADVELPPFHPYCNCTYYYETAEIDDIKDLDLERDL
jgi:hypothetical protein